MIFLKDIQHKKQIKFGHYYHSPKGIEHLCAKTVRKLLTHCSDYPNVFAESGSVTLVNFRNKSYALCTLHQAGLKNPLIMDKETAETLLIPSLNNKLISLPAEMLIHSTEKGDEEFKDIIALKLFENSELLKKEKCYFSGLPVKSSPKALKHFYIGYPRLDGNVRMNENGEALEIMLRCSIGNCYPTKKTSIRYFESYELDPSEFTMDGTSGGAVFKLIDHGDNDYEIVLGGIVIRAGKNKLHAINSEYLKLLLEH